MNIFSENRAFLKIMKQDLTEFWNNNLLQIGQKIYKYEYKNGEYNVSLNSTKNTRMHQNEYLFSKIFRGWHPRTPDFCWDPADMSTPPLLFFDNSHTVLS